MKDLDSFTVERLEELTSLMDFHTEWYPTIYEIKTLARIALAAKRAEPVMFRFKYPGERNYTYITHRKPDAFEMEKCEIELLYTAPQLNSPEIPDERLIALANHIQSSLGGLPDEWQSWADEIVSDLRKYAAPEKENG
ncbi:hypothetical protein [Yersinia proxima]|uniref:hypothetical protein n=1 Tax=Yersinia proxima TaxID=2890316 RepID=UPI001D11CFD9|nr:hypothetical protein [Yersinia proxima]